MEPIETCWIAEACAQYFKIRRAYVVATDKALRVTWPNLERAFAKICETEPIRIADGNSEEELWQIFESIVEPIPEECELVIDITHGFRSQPLIAMAIAIYLREVKRVTVAHVVYGAFDAKNKESGIVPIFALDTFLDLIDWTFAISQFGTSGNASLLKGIMQKSRSGEKDQLGLIAADLEATSRALHLLRPKETHRLAQKATTHLKNAKRDIRANIKAKPLLPLLDEVENMLNEFSTDYKEKDGKGILMAHLKMISWYLHKEKYIHAICLALEWFGRFHAYYTNLDFTRKEFRQKAMEELNKIINGSNNKSKLHPDFPVELFKLIRDTRNQVAHANDEYPSSTLIRKIKDYCTKLINFGGKLFLESS